MPRRMGWSIRTFQHSEKSGPLLDYASRLHHWYLPWGLRYDFPPVTRHAISPRSCRRDNFSRVIITGKPMSDPQTNAVPAEVRRLLFLVAESNPALRKTIVNRLEQAGVKDCAAVESGDEAWKIWQQTSRVGVIIASIKLREIGGIELLKRVRADSDAGLQPAFIVMSDDDSPQAMDQAVREGADCFALKPFPLGSLSALVGESVAHRKQIAGENCFLRVLEVSSEDAPIRAILTYEGRWEETECEMISGAKCVIVSHHNFGLGTMLELCFVRPPHLGEGNYEPLKGQVNKMERMRGEFGIYRVHLQFSTPPREEQGIRDLLLAGDSQ